MLGGGVFVTQNKVLPGSYINIVSLSSATANLGDRGVVAVALPLNHKAGKVITVTASDFVTNSEELLGVAYSDKSLDPLREMFLHATVVYVYDLGENGKVADAITAFDSYDFNVLCVYGNNADETTQYIAAVKNWRDNYGKKCQAVVYNSTAPNYEGIINVVSTVSDNGAPAYALTAWVAGAEAGCNISASCTNMLYDGQYSVVVDKSQSELESYLTTGKFAFHNVYGDVRVLEDINSLTEFTADKGEDFKYNQTIRVIDQIANDIARVFNTKYLGKIPNNKSGRVSLWGDIVAHHKQLEAMQAIENFDSSMVTVEQGNTKKSVVVTDAITVTNAMAQLYMTVVIQ